MNHCPTDSEFDLYLTGQHTGEIGHHVEKCPVCQAKLGHQDEGLFADLQKVRRQSKLIDDRDSAIDPESFESELNEHGYEIVSEIFCGGQAVVFKARQLTTRRFVAVKKLNLARKYDAEKLLRFQREIDVVARLKHPNIVTIFDSGTAAGSPYYVMELVEGVSLSEYCSAQFGFSNPANACHKNQLQALLELTRKICSAVNHAHRNGIIHRDLKPQNILIDSHGNLRVLDFGLAKLDDDHLRELTQEGQFLGTLAFASPEQLAVGQEFVDVRSDVYALGVILYEQLSGQLPYDVDRTLTDSVENILHAEPKPLSQQRIAIDRDIETIILKALAKDPNRRYQSIEQMDRDIELYLNGQAIEARRDSKSYVIAKFLQRNKVWVSTVAIVAIIVVCALVVSLKFWNDASKERDIAQAAVTSESNAKVQAQYRSNIANTVAAKGAVLDGDVADAQRRLGEVSYGFRDWEWFYLMNRTDESIRTVKNHDLYIRDFAIFPDGKTIVSISGEGDLRIWSIDHPLAQKKLDLKTASFPCRLNSDASQVAVASYRTIRVFSTTDLSEIYQLQAKHQIEDFLFWPSSEGVYFCGKNPVTGNAEIGSWNFQTGVYSSFPGQWDGLRSIDLEPSGDQVAFAGDQLGLLDPLTGKCRVIDNERTYHLVRFHPSKKQLAAVAGWKVFVFDTQTMELIKQLDANQPISNICFDSLGQSLTICGRNLQVWDLNSATLSRTWIGHEQPVTQSRFLPEPGFMISSSKDAMFKIWNLGSPRNPQINRFHNKPVRDIDCSADGKLIASGSEDGNVAIFDWQGNLKRVIPHHSPVFAVSFLPDQKRIASAGDDGIIRIWDLDGQLCQELKGHRDRVHSLDFDEDGKRLVSASRDKTVRVWDMSSASTMFTFEGHGDCVHNAIFDQSGLRIASRCHLQIKVWNARSGIEFFSFDQRMGSEDYSLVFHPRKSYLAAGSSIAGFGKGFTNIYDLESGELVSVLEKHDSPINAFDYNPAGTRAVSASNESIKIWDLEHSNDIINLDGIDLPVYCVRFSHDGSRIIAGFHDGRIMTWNAGQGQRQ